MIFQIGWIAMNKWKDVETAPRDGTNILGATVGLAYYYPETVYFGHYHPNAKGKACWRSCNSRNKVRVDVWMPLPKEPE